MNLGALLWLKINVWAVGASSFSRSILVLRERRRKLAASVIRFTADTTIPTEGDSFRRVWLLLAGHKDLVRYLDVIRADDAPVTIGQYDNLRLPSFGFFGLKLSEGHNHQQVAF